MNDTPELIAASLQKYLNSHGHSFHQAVLQRIVDLSVQREAPWSLVGSEFPVVLNGEGSHADIILRSNSGIALLVAECKRANPSHSHWVFVKAPPTRRSCDSQITLETFETVDDSCVGLSLNQFSSPKGPYHLSAALRTGLEGDREGTSTRQIDEAVSQLFRVTSGFINHFFSRAHTVLASAEPSSLTVVPTIFTTATLWVAECDLGTTDLATGNVKAEAIKVQPVNWVWFNHNRSPLLSHTFRMNADKKNLRSDLERLFTRSVAIVNVSGLNEFLGIEQLRQMTHS
jgi:hypothetical protein